MSHNPLAQAAIAGALYDETFTWRGVPFRVCGKPLGDDYFSVLYPDTMDAFRKCAHHATGNNRIVDGKVVSYPVEIYGDVLAILATYVPPEGAPPTDISSVFALHDADPGLFAQLRGHALIALGIADASSDNSGKAAWEAVFITAKKLEAALKEGKADVAANLAKAIRQGSAVALKDFAVDVGEDAGEDDPRDTDPAMEEIAGKS